MTASLYIVATPIGNLGDMTQRAVDVLQSVDYIAAEDTRHSARLAQHFAIKTPMLAYHEHAGEGQAEKVLSLLQQGHSVALISDAGTPLISDPGYRLVRKAHEQNIHVVPVPGASAVITALCASGLATDHFSFEGFLPAKAGARQGVLSQLAEVERTLIFYEAPHRILECLQDMLVLFGAERRVCLARELTKTFETIRQLPLDEMVAWVESDSNQQRGEIVLMVEGVKNARSETLDAAAQQLAELLVKEMAPKPASKIVAEYCQVPKKAVYDYLLSVKK